MHFYLENNAKQDFVDNGKSGSMRRMNEEISDFIRAEGLLLHSFAFLLHFPFGQKQSSLTGNL